MNTQDGWILIDISPDLRVASPDAAMADERVEVYSRDSSGQWYRTYVERNEDGPPFVTTEKVAAKELHRKYMIRSWRDE